MRNLLYICSFGLLLLAACSKPEVADLFDKLPEERMLERNAELKDVLLNAPNGWKAFLKTSLNGGGYGFFMDFTDQGTVKMLADWDDETSVNFKESTYRIKYISNATLIFDTYTYITILQDPDDAHNGGEQKEGLQSDIEFEYARTGGDTLFLTGRKYRNTLYLIKATAAEEQSFMNGGYDDAINRIRDLFESTHPMILFDNNGTQEKIELGLNASAKVVSGDYLSPNDSVSSASSGIAYSIDGAYFVDGLVNMGIHFSGLRWKNSTDIVAYDSSGKEYEVIRSPAPLIPLDVLLGTKFSLQARYKTITPGMTPEGEAIIAHYVNNLDNRYAGYVFNNGTLTLHFDLVNNRLIAEGWSNQNGNGGWITTIVFDYTKDPATKVYGFTLRTPASGGYVSKLMYDPGQPNIQEFLLNNHVKFDYYTEDGVTYGRMASVDNPDIVLTFILEDA